MPSFILYLPLFLSLNISIFSISFCLCRQISLSLFLYVLFLCFLPSHSLSLSLNFFLLSLCPSVSFSFVTSDPCRRPPFRFPVSVFLDFRCLRFIFPLVPRCHSREQRFYWTSCLIGLIGRIFLASFLMAVYQSAGEGKHAIKEAIKPTRTGSVWGSSSRLPTAMVGSSFSGDYASSMRQCALYVFVFFHSTVAFYFPWKKCILLGIVEKLTG